MKKTTRTDIMWKVTSQAAILPKSDLQWSLFCVIEEPGTHRGSAQMVVAALNANKPQFHFRLRGALDKKANPSEKVSGEEMD